MPESTSLLNVTFDRAPVNSVGVDVVALSELRSRTPSAILRVAQRVDFLHLLLIESGAASHMVDFQNIDLSPHTLLVILPGQVHRWGDLTKIDGLLMLARPDIFPPQLSGGGVLGDAYLGNNAGSHSLPSAAHEEIAGDFCGIYRDLNKFQINELDFFLVRYQALAAIFRCARYTSNLYSAASAKSALDMLAERFEREVERNYLNRLRVDVYADMLGASVSSLTRACLKRYGRSAKDLIDDRLLLEAKRLLTYTSLNSSQVAYELGFTEPTNFVKFFKRKTGKTPLEFKGRSFT